MKCTRCGKIMGTGIAIQQTWVGSDDFGGDYGQSGTTWSAGGPGKVIDCLKCKSCGHSATLGRKRHFQPKKKL